MHKIVVITLLSFLTNIVTAQDKALFEPLPIGLTTHIQSAKLNEQRTINIYLPAGYNEKDTVTYPVIYVVDGGMQEDFVHLSGLVQYSAQSWVNRIHPSIVVGIENTNRKRDFTFAVDDLDFLKKVGFTKENIPQYGGSANYIAFIGQELQPFISEHFKTNNSRTLIGESLGGLLATEIYTRHRQLFNNYIIISPSLWWGNEVLLKEIADKGAETNGVRVYVGAPDKNEMPVMYDDALQLSKVIQQRSPRAKVYFDYLPKETHATVIHQAAYNALRWLSEH